MELDYDRSAGAVLDLGCFGPGGFRGWSGSSRESFVIARDAATPGYLPGELEAGTWQVMIGVHRIPPDGVAYRLTAQTATTAAALDPGPARARAAGPAGPAAAPGCCRPGRAAAGWPATCTRIPCTRTAR